VFPIDFAHCEVAPLLLLHNKNIVICSAASAGLVGRNFDPQELNVPV